MIALTDHNSCKNCEAFLKACEFYGIMGVPGMELTTEEEVHVICLFPTLSDAMRFDEMVYERILDIKNDERIFGRQLVMNEEDEVIRHIDRLLISATDISFDDTYDLVHKYNGIMYPAHVDKRTTSLISQLGFVPPDAKFKTAEFKNLANLHEYRKNHPYFNDCKIISSSDAHYLKDINQPVNTIFLEEKSRESLLSYLDS